MIRLEKTAAAAGAYDIGIAANSDFLIDNAGIARLFTMTAAGNAGIGTASPAGKLTILANAASMNQFIRFENTESGHARIWNFGMATGSSGAFVLNDLTAGVERMRVDSVGNVGIGTTAPAAKLHVQRDAAVSTDYALSQLLLGGTDGNKRLALAFDTTYNVGLIQAYVHTGPVEDLVLQSAGGNVGIGTMTPSHKLAVNGTIRAKEVIVDTGWSDYVFADDYRLAPLAEVEAHIKARKHLPGIPSAAEVEAGGVSLGDMQSKLLAKVEELTLHMIDLKKENVLLRREIEALKQSRQ
jgi:hypothetical protein